MGVVSIIADTSDTSVQLTGSNYATVRAAATGSAIRSASVDTFYIWNDKEGSTFGIERAFLTFNTGPVIPVHAQILSATLSLRTAGDVTNNNGYSIHLEGATPANNASIVLADYDQVAGPPSFGSIASVPAAFTSFSIPLTQAGINAIVKGSGKTQFALRSGGDHNNQTPTAANRVQIRSANHETASFRPTLEIVTADGGAFLYNFI